jgi:DHA2 family multidrug resistance protein
MAALAEQRSAGRTDIAAAPAKIAARRLWAIALTVTMATFMELLDTSISNVSLPHIAGGLGTSYDESTWVLTSYLVANAIILPMSAWLSRALGRKRYYMICVALFTASSFLCGVAPSLAMLIAFRVLQGIGGGLAPVEQAILVDTFPKEKLGGAFALYSMAIVTAPAIGPPLGGWITDNFSWRWVFFINVPIGILSLLLSNRLVHDPVEFTEERKQARRSGRLRIDYVGITLIAAGFACLEVVLDRGERERLARKPLHRHLPGDCCRRHWDRDLVGVAPRRSGGRADPAARAQLRDRQPVLLPVRLRALRQHGTDS